jgi:hypothetical protein
MDWARMKDGKISRMTVRLIASCELLIATTAAPEPAATELNCGLQRPLLSVGRQGGDHLHVESGQ